MPAKVLLVEDDNNLREIYQARLMAEGYTIVTARDGEEALGVAKAEMPDLIISDVMMPRVSGFEMLDILRNTEGLKDVKVIMLTALGQADDKTRANSLGADRYLVKSQVTLEDIVKSSHELLEGPAAPMPPAAPASAGEPTAPVPVAPEPPAPQAGLAMPPVVPAPASQPGVPAEPVAVTAQPPAPTVAEEQASMNDQIQQFMNTAVTTPAPAPDATAAQDDAVIANAVQDLASSSTAADSTLVAVPAVPATPAPEPAAAAPADSMSPQNDTVAIANKKVIQPLSGEAPKSPIHEILAREEAAGMHSDMAAPPVPATTFSPTTSAAPAAPMGPAVGTPTAPTVPQPPIDPGSISL